MQSPFKNKDDSIKVDQEAIARKATQNQSFGKLRDQDSDTENESRQFITGRQQKVTPQPLDEPLNSPEKRDPEKIKFAQYKNFKFSRGHDLEEMICHQRRQAQFLLPQAACAYEKQISFKVANVDLHPPSEDSTAKPQPIRRNSSIRVAEKDKTQVSIKIYRVVGVQRQSPGDFRCPLVPHLQDTPPKDLEKLTCGKCDENLKYRGGDQYYKYFDGQKEYDWCVKCALIMYSQVALLHKQHQARQVVGFKLPHLESYTPRAKDGEEEPVKTPIIQNSNMAAAGSVILVIEFGNKKKKTIWNTGKDSLVFRVANKQGKPLLYCTDTSSPSRTQWEVGIRDFYIHADHLWETDGPFDKDEHYMSTPFAVLAKKLDSSMDELDSWQDDQRGDVHQHVKLNKTSEVYLHPTTSVESGCILAYQIGPMVPNHIFIARHQEDQPQMSVDLGDHHFFCFVHNPEPDGKVVLLAWDKEYKYLRLLEIFAYDSLDTKAQTKDFAFTVSKEKLHLPALDRVACLNTVALQSGSRIVIQINGHDQNKNTVFVAHIDRQELIEENCSNDKDNIYCDKKDECSDKESDNDQYQDKVVTNDMLYPQPQPSPRDQAPSTKQSKAPDQKYHYAARFQRAIMKIQDVEQEVYNVENQLVPVRNKPGEILVLKKHASRDLNEVYLWREDGSGTLLKTLTSSTFRPYILSATLPEWDEANQTYKLQMFSVGESKEKETFAQTQSQTLNENLTHKESTHFLPVAADNWTGFKRIETVGNSVILNTENRVVCVQTHSPEELDLKHNEILTGLTSLSCEQEEHKCEPSFKITAASGLRERNYISYQIVQRTGKDFDQILHYRYRLLDPQSTRPELRYNFGEKQNEAWTPARDGIILRPQDKWLYLRYKDLIAEPLPEVDEEFRASEPHSLAASVQKYTHEDLHLPDSSPMKQPELQMDRFQQSYSEYDDSPCMVVTIQSYTQDKITFNASVRLEKQFVPSGEEKDWENKEDSFQLGSKFFVRPSKFDKTGRMIILIVDFKFYLEDINEGQTLTLPFKMIHSQYTNPLFADYIFKDGKRVYGTLLWWDRIQGNDEKKLMLTSVITGRNMDHGHVAQSLASQDKHFLALKCRIYLEEGRQPCFYISMLALESLSIQTSKPSDQENFHLIEDCFIMGVQKSVFQYLVKKQTQLLHFVKEQRVKIVRQYNHHKATAAVVEDPDEEERAPAPDWLINAEKFVLSLCLPFPQSEEVLHLQGWTRSVSFDKMTQFDHLLDCIQKPDDQKRLIMDVLQIMEAANMLNYTGQLFKSFDKLKILANQPGAITDKAMESLVWKEATIHNQVWDLDYRILAVGVDDEAIESVNLERVFYDRQLRRRLKKKLPKFMQRMFNSRGESERESVKAFINKGRFRQVTLQAQLVDMRPFKNKRKEFFSLVSKSPNKFINRIDWVHALLKQDTYKTAIFLKCFLPAVLYYALSTYYIVMHIQEPAPGFLSEAFLTTRLCLCVLWVYQAGNEIGQAIHDIAGYASSFWNAVSLSSLGLNAFVIYTMSSTVVDIEDLTVRRSASINLLLLWMQLLYWCRAFETFSFYWELIFQTLKDILPMIFILFIFLIAFGCSIYCLDQISPAQQLDLSFEDESELIPNFFGSRLVDSVFGQYLLGLGEFNLDRIGDNESSELVWVLFFLSTFVTQVTILNMLIARMGDTFACVFENRYYTGLQAETEIIHEYSHLIKSNQFWNSKYALILKPLMEGDDENQEWQGNVNALRSQIKATEERIAQRLNKVGGTSDKIKTLTKDTQERFSKLETKIESVEQAVKNLPRQLENLIGDDLQQARKENALIRAENDMIQQQTTKKKSSTLFEITHNGRPFQAE